MPLDKVNLFDIPEFPFFFAYYDPEGFCTEDKIITNTETGIENGKKNRKQTPAAGLIKKTSKLSPEFSNFSGLWV
jgi:hypothetical protein